MTNKELAEWSAEFLGLLKIEDADGWELPWNNHEWLIAPNNFFGGPFAPTLMDLAQVEMEKRGHSHTLYTHTEGVVSYTAYVQPISAGAEVVYSEHENKFIAFWTAVMQAIKEE